MKPEDFAGQGPTLRLETYFLGTTRGWGIFEDRFGNLRRQYTIDIVGRMDDDVLLLAESYIYTDGETGVRNWRIRCVGTNGYEAEADDLVGKAVGSVYGNVLNWRYRIDLNAGSSVWRVGFDEWMYLQEDDVLISRASVTRFGFRIGTVSLFFRRMG
jgi:hypothetical protein